MILASVPISLSPGEVAFVQNAEVGIEQYVGLSDGTPWPARGYKIIMGELVFIDPEGASASSNVTVVYTKNTIGTFSVTNTTPGCWNLTCAGAFPHAKLRIEHDLTSCTNDDGTTTNMSVTWVDDSTIQIACTNTDGGYPIDGMTIARKFTVMVFP